MKQIPLLFLTGVFALLTSCNTEDLTPTITVPSDSLTVADSEGRIYPTISIGTQVWMAENLRTTKYNDGTNIPQVNDTNTWKNLVTPGFCWYNNDSANYSKNGALYNWYAVNTGKLAPTGWHVATKEEWTKLIAYLGGENIAGAKLKEAGTTHWLKPNTGATNESGFYALPAGHRFGHYGTFSYVGELGYWWTATQSSTTNANLRILYNNNDNAYGFDYNKSYGFSVRCVRDELANVTTKAASTITTTTAITGGTISFDGGASITVRGVCWNTMTNPTIANSKSSNGIGSGTFTSSITGLSASTTYYVRSYATNSVGTAYGNEITFTTLP